MLQPRPQTRWPFWLMLAIAPLVFFFTEHSLTTSLAEAFTQSADEMLATAEGGNIIRRIAYPLFGLTGFLLALTPTGRPFQFSPTLCLLVAALIFWCSISVLWSFDPSMTTRRLLVLYFVLLAGWGTARHLRLSQILWLTLLVNFGFLIVGFLAELSLGTFRPWAGDHRFSGTLHPNTQGLNLAAMCFAAICLVRIRPDRRVFLWSVFGIGMVFLYLTKSRTSFLGVFIALGAIWSLSVPFLYKFATVCVGLWCVGVAGLLMILAGTDITESASDAALMGREEQAESLTGRLPLWTELSGYAKNRLLTGHGYEAFWTPQHIDAVSSELGWGLREAHNSFLDAVLGIGLIGLLLALAIGGVALLHASNAAIATKNPGYAFLVALIVFGMLNSFTESSMIMVSCYTYLLMTGIFHLALKPLDEEQFASQRPA